jgi:hypothetical protein
MRDTPPELVRKYIGKLKNNTIRENEWRLKMISERLTDEVFKMRPVKSEGIGLAGQKMEKTR